MSFKIVLCSAALERTLTVKLRPFLKMVHASVCDSTRGHVDVAANQVGL